jgi:hypothetical protein
MNLQEWREKRVETLTLPSGLVATIRNIGIFDLAARGNIPETLDVLVKQATAPEGFSVSDVLRFVPLIDVVVQACLIDPPLAEEADAVHLTLAEIPIEDRLAIFAHVNGAADALRPFRSNGAADAVAAGSAGAGVRQPAKRHSRRQR